VITRRRVLCIPVDFDFPDGELTERLQIESMADALALEVADLLPLSFPLGPAFARVDIAATTVQRP
jgi:hypothetical protein